MNEERGTIGSSSERPAVVTVRAATAADQEPLGRFGGALMRQHHAADPRRFMQVDDPDPGYGRFLVSQIGNPNSLVMVAEHAGAVIGYTFADVEPTNWMELRGPCGVLQDIYVDDSARRLGAGRALMRAAIEWIRSKGRSQVVLMTKSRNEHAQHLFAALGFRPTMIEMTLDLDVQGGGVSMDAATPFTPHAWESFYVIVGSTAGALIGLQFVVLTLISEGGAIRGSEEALAAFGSPNVVHFCGALLVSATLSAPWQGLGPPGVALAIAGVCGFVYSVMVLGRALRQRDYRPVLEDWIWHAVLPMLAYAALVHAGTRIAHSPDSLFVVGGSALLLVFIGIHNAWDTVVYVTMERSRERKAAAKAAERPLAPVSSLAPRPQEDAPAASTAPPKDDAPPAPPASN